jgi:6-phosphogluconolactonase
MSFIVNSIVRVFMTPELLAAKFASEFAAMAGESVKRKRHFSVALSGGSTPAILFSQIGDYYAKTVPWEYVHFFWGDERCVPPDSPESNYGMARDTLLRKIVIPPANLHRIRGEDDPEVEAGRYSGEILNNTAVRNDLPEFDLVILGLGEDGHTASIFPGNEKLLDSGSLCAVAVHPETHQKRITVTGRVIKNSDHICFIVTGKKKAKIVKEIINKAPGPLYYPASGIVPEYGDLTWFLDADAAALL